MTDYSDVFQAFTAKITDRDRALMDSEVNEQDMIDLLNAAITKFRLPHISLSKDDDTQILKDKNGKAMKMRDVAECWELRVLNFASLRVQPEGLSYIYFLTARRAS